VGDTIKVDGKGRITLPSNVRKIVRGNVFKVEVAGKDRIILSVLEDRRKFVEKVRNIKLTGDKKRANVDAAWVKDFYGGTKD